MIWLIALLNLIFIAADSIRDKGVERKIGWWEWHCAKWISFFGQQLLIILMAIKAGYIPIKTISIWFGILYLIFCSIIWNLFYKGD